MSFPILKTSGADFNPCSSCPSLMICHTGMACQQVLQQEATSTTIRRKRYIEIVDIDRRLDR
jgi:hypothetical protein